MLKVLDQLLRSAGSYSRDQGEWSFARSTVSQLRISSDVITAKVHGSFQYTITIFRNGRYSCDCLSYRFPCKHIVAVALAAQERLQQPTQQLILAKRPHFWQLVKLQWPYVNLRIVEHDQQQNIYAPILFDLEEKNTLHAILRQGGYEFQLLADSFLLTYKSLAQIVNRFLESDNFDLPFTDLIAPSGSQLNIIFPDKPLLTLVQTGKKLSLQLKYQNQNYPLGQKSFISFPQTLPKRLDSKIFNDNWDDDSFDEDDPFETVGERYNDSQQYSLMMANDYIIGLNQAELLCQFTNFKQGSLKHAYLNHEARHGILKRFYDFENLSSFPAPPLPVSTPQVRITLNEHYQSQRFIFLNIAIDFVYQQTIVSDKPANDSVIKSGNKYFLRDTRLEKASARLLYGAKDRYKGYLPSEMALEFIFEHLPTFPKEWLVIKNLDYFDFTNDEIKINIKEDAGQGWFDLSFSLPQSLRRSLSKRTIQEILRKRPKYIHSAGGKWVKCSPALVNSISLAYFIGPHVLAGKEEKISAFQVMGFWQYCQSDQSLRLPETVRQTIQALKSFDGIQSPLFQDNLAEVLRHYQKDGVAWLEFLHQHNLSGVLADDMGLGKTLQTLVFLWRLKQAGKLERCVIVAPASGVGAWATETEKFLPDFKLKIIDGPWRQSIYDNWANYDLYVMSYAVFTNDAERLRQLPINYLIIDEAQFIKNPNTKRSRALFSVKSERRLALTGTPLENRLSELWSIFHFIMPGYLGSLDYFRDIYEKPVVKDNNLAPIAQLREKIKPFLLRRLKSVVEKELPPKTETPVFCELTENQKKIYLHTLSLARQELFAIMKQKGVEKSYIHFLAVLTKLRQVCDHPALIFDKPDKHLTSGKFEAFKEHLQEVLAEQHYVLVFSQFTMMLAHIRAWLEEEKIPYLYLDGATKNRAELVKTFDQGQYPVFLISLKAGGTSLTLTRADYVVHYDPWWNPAVENQATDRAHRIGQNKHVFVHKFYCRGTIEEKILKLQQKKGAVFDAVMAGSLNSPFKLTRDEIEDILTPNFDGAV